MPRTREEWAIAIAQRFFTEDLGDTQVHIHVTSEVLCEIASVQAWNLATPEDARTSRRAV